MKKILALWLIQIVCITCTSEKSLKDWTSCRAKYIVEGSSDALPKVSHVELSLPKKEPGNSSDSVWFQFEAFSNDKRLFAVALLVRSLDFLYRCGKDVCVERYILFPSEKKPIEFIQKSTGEALLPKFDFFQILMPHATRVGDPEMPFFREGTYLGRLIRRVEMGRGARKLPLEGLRRLELEKDILIGNSRSFRDDGSGRLYFPGKPEPSGKPDYNYVPLDKNDYRRMMEAGMNVFRVPYEHLPWIIEKPVFFLVRKGFEHMPEILYRSNFFGSVMYMDEPAIRAMAFDVMFSEFKSPQKAAEVVVELTRGRYYGSGGYGMNNMSRLLQEAGYDFGGVKITQPDYPVWETVPSAAWYECEAGISGWCFEGRYQPRWFAGLVKRELGVDFPSSAEACIDYHHAFFTGAARFFGTKWGVAIYGQMDFEAAQKTFPIAYEQGATYFWFWTSDHAHHVPFEEQLELTRKFREYVETHPRQASTQDKTASANTAIVLPWGYLCDHYSLKLYREWDKNFDDGRMWWSRHMELGDKNSQGIYYREVLKAAVQEAANLLRKGIRFDFLFLRRGQQALGYEKVIRIRENGSVIVE